MVLTAYFVLSVAPPVLMSMLCLKVWPHPCSAAEMLMSLFLIVTTAFLAPRFAAWVVER